MAKGASKFDFKQFLLNKGEYLAIGLAGFFLVVLFGWGVSRWAGAKDPAKISKDLTSNATQLTSRIKSGEPSEQDLKDAALPAFLKDDYKHIPVASDDFRLTGPQFDPIARPDTKRENPIVFPLGEFQYDILKAPMKGYEIVNPRENEYLIGVVVAKAVGEQDKEKLKKIGKKVIDRTKSNQRNFPGNQNPGGMPPMGGGLGGTQPPPMGGMGGGPPPGMMGMGGRGMGGRGEGMMGGYNIAAQRVDKALTYINLDELDGAIKDGKIPAMTVIPLRGIIIHMEVPYRLQLEEMKRALRLKHVDEARKIGPIYDGYEVQRRVSRVIDGKEVVIVDWPADIKKPNYDFEAKYAELINARKLEDNLEDGWLLHFIRYDMALSLPLPRLVDELGGYPKIRLPGINATIKKMQDANRKPEDASALLQRIQGKTGRAELYTPQTASQTGANSFYGQEGVSGSDVAAPGGGVRPPGGMVQPPPGTIQPPAGGMREPGDMTNSMTAPPIEIDHLLLRFLDVDVQPGYTYEYRIRLKMLNPNYAATPKDEKVMEKIVSNPAYMKEKTLYSPWTKVRDAITIPTEEFSFAIDPAAYRTKIAEEYKEQKDKELRDRLQAKDHQAVVEIARWMEEVPIGSGKREPVGAWVVADIPTGRGEYVGRKQYVKLPLWSAVTNQYVLREVGDRLVTSKKDSPQPKGWLVDFSSKDILVDFEGGRVKTKTRNREVTEDAATEMLIVRSDGQLEVKKSAKDEDDAERKKFLSVWESWLKKVEVRKEVPPGGFDRGGPPGGTGT